MIPQSLVYHEAGHAVMFWFYGIPIEYVSIVPEFAGGRGTWTKTAVNPPTTGQSELEKWMRAAAAGEAAEGNCGGSEVPEASALAPKLDAAVRKLDEESLNHDAAPKDHDYRNLACLGLDRDKDIAREGTGAETGTAAWAPIWLEAENMVREDLWAAVEAVADGLESSLGTDHHGWLSSDEVGELASVAMARSGAAQPPE
jgi:hypothetical protein